VSEVSDFVAGYPTAAAVERLFEEFDHVLDRRPDYQRQRSVDIHFGPEPPAGMEANWIATIPEEGWFALLRLYGPEAPILEKTWRPNDLVRVASTPQMKGSRT